MAKKLHGSQHGITLKKQYGQHFLRTQSVVDHMLSQVHFTSESSVFEIGCGDGFLSRAIVQQPLKRFWIFEIDHQWAEYVRKTYPDGRMTIFEEDFLQIDFKRFEPFKPWILLANLPYQITFPILYKLQQHRELLQEGVIMVQEEVAQKIVKMHGRGYGFHSLFLQRYFEWKLLQKVPPGAFYPPPKVDSRLLYFKPKIEVEPIHNEAEFWQFIKRCFQQPRRTLRNNLQTYHYDLTKVPEVLLIARAQQLSMKDLLELWNLLQTV